MELITAVLKSNDRIFFGVLCKWLRAGKDVDEKDRRGQTALYHACEKGSYKKAKALLVAGANPNIESRWLGSFPLLLAVENGNKRLVRLLVRYRASPNYRPGYIGASGTAFWQSLFSSSDLRIPKFFIEHGANVNDINRFDKTCLLHDLEDEDINVALLLLRNGCRPNVRDEQGWTPLHDAAKGGHALIVEALLQHGAEVNAQKPDGWTALHLAAFNNRPEVIAVLLRYGADDTLRNNDGNPPDLSSYYASLRAYKAVTH